MAACTARRKTPPRRHSLENIEDNSLTGRGALCGSRGMKPRLSKNDTATSALVVVTEENTMARLRDVRERVHQMVALS